MSEFVTYYTLNKGRFHIFGQILLVWIIPAPGPLSVLFSASELIFRVVFLLFLQSSCKLIFFFLALETGSQAALRLTKYGLEQFFTLWLPRPKHRDYKHRHSSLAHVVPLLKPEASTC